MGTSSVWPSMVTGRPGSSRNSRAISAIAGCACSRSFALPESKNSASRNSMPRPSASSRVRTLSFSSGVRATSASTFSRRSSSGACRVPLSAAAMRSNCARFMGTAAMMRTKKPTSSVSMSA
jgi:hypothetical protein